MGGRESLPAAKNLPHRDIAARNTAGAETRPPGCDSWWSLGGSASSPTATCQKCPEVMRGNLVKACVGPYFFLVVVFFVVFLDVVVFDFVF